MTDLKTHAPESIAKVLIGNKADLCAEDPQARKVPLDLAKSFALQNDMDYFEVSAKTGQQVEESFMKLTTKINGLKLTSQQMMLGGDNQVKLDQDGNEMDAGNGVGLGGGMNDSIGDRMSKKKLKKQKKKGGCC